MPVSELKDFAPFEDLICDLLTHVNRPVHSMIAFPKTRFQSLEPIKPARVIEFDVPRFFYLDIRGFLLLASFMA